MSDTQVVNTQVVNTKEEDLYPLSSYSLDELNELNTLIIQSLNHYTGLFKDEKLMATLKDGDVFALKLCLKETEAEMKLIADEIASRGKK
jgi:hypothetical protein